MHLIQAGGRARGSREWPLPVTKRLAVVVPVTPSAELARVSFLVSLMMTAPAKVSLRSLARRCGLHLGAALETADRLLPWRSLGIVSLGDTVSDPIGKYFHTVPRNRLEACLKTLIIMVGGTGIERKRPVLAA